MRNKTDDNLVFNDSNNTVYNYDSEQDSYVVVATYADLGINSKMTTKRIEILAVVYLSKKGYD
ncbi:MAG: hypothetical protein KAJ49_09795 [Arcobacteraceae bacterium]|nr:hypothetical protein [Arcobacteraceae bacterium]